MTASSAEERFFSPAPEFRNLLAATRRIREEVSRIGRRTARDASYSRLLKRLDDLEESLRVHFEELQGLERDLAAAASAGLTEKQRLLLRWMAENYRGRMVYTALIGRISEELGIPRSTVRWNLRGLREAGLIRAGDRDSKGVPVSLTERGALMAWHAAGSP